MARIAIVGAGPAGSSAGWHLASRGQDVDLIDRAVFPRPKVCGDWIAPLAVAELEQLGLARGDIERIAADRAPINATIIVAPNGRISRCDIRARAFGLPRLVFDAALWRHAVDAGCRPMQRDVGDMRPLRADHDFVIDARGAQAGATNAIAIRAYWTVNRRHLAQGEDTDFQIHTDAAVRRGYGWIIPVRADTDTVRFNVGIALAAPHGVPECGVTDAYERFARDNSVLARWSDAAVSDAPVECGVALGLGRNSVTVDGVIRIGDAANLADPLTGQGIGNALTSGRLAADAILQALDDGGVDNEAKEKDREAARLWQARYDEVFAPELHRARLLQRALVTSAAKNVSAGLLAGAPGLRARIHGALFGEARYRDLTEPWM